MVGYDVGGIAGHEQMLEIREKGMLKAISYYLISKGPAGLSVKVQR
jgi:hypothetical protein